VSIASAQSQFIDVTTKQGLSITHFPKGWQVGATIGMLDKEPLMAVTALPTIGSKGYGFRFQIGSIGKDYHQQLGIFRNVGKAVLSGGLQLRHTNEFKSSVFLGIGIKL
jgi:hypothetical protein